MTKNKSGFTVLMRLQARDISLMKIIVQKFMKPGSLAKKACTGKFPVANACTFQLMYRRLTGCDV